VDYEATKRVLAALEREGVHYLVFGAAALNFHGLARFTEDLDLFVKPTRENIDRLKRALHAAFDDPHIDESQPTTCWASIRPSSMCRRTAVST
jgi:Nucleotidyl transferase AbiEii toxin, Type IV TA system